jgi:hypothetical protein
MFIASIESKKVEIENEYDWWASFGNITDLSLVLERARPLQHSPVGQLLGLLVSWLARVIRVCAYPFNQVTKGQNNPITG